MLQKDYDYLAFGEPPRDLIVYALRIYADDLIASQNTVLNRLALFSQQKALLLQQYPDTKQDLFPLEMTKLNYLIEQITRLIDRLLNPRS